MEFGLRIGELAALAGVSVRTVHHYHAIGLLAEPERAANGYRRYGLADVVRLLRARRLAELGLGLDAVAGVLTSEGGDLRAILGGLDRDLAEQQRRIRRQRDRIALLLSSDLDEAGSTVPADLVADLARTLGAGHPGLTREAGVLEALGAMDGVPVEQVQDATRHLLDNHGDLVRDVHDRFERLAGCAPDDPAVEQLARAAGAFVHLLDARKASVSAPDPGSDGAEGLLRAAAADLSPAQSRCLSLMAEHWKRAGT